MHKRLDPPLLDGEMEEERDTSQGPWLASRSWKTPENRFSPERLERTLPCPADTLTSAQGDPFRTCDLRNRGIMSSLT